MRLTKEEELNIRKIYGDDVVEMVKNSQNFDSMRHVMDDLNEVSGKELQETVETVREPEEDYSDMLEEAPSTELKKEGTRYVLWESDKQFLRSLDYRQSDEFIKAQIYQYSRDHGVDYETLREQAYEYKVAREAEYASEKETEKEEDDLDPMLSYRPGF